MLYTIIDIGFLVFMFVSYWFTRKSMKVCKRKGFDNAFLLIVIWFLMARVLNIIL